MKNIHPSPLQSAVSTSLIGLFRKAKTVSALLFILLQFLVTSMNAQNTREATISIDLNRPVEKVSPMVFGQFIEYLGRCVNGGIYEEGSPLSDENGFRKDVLQ